MRSPTRGHLKSGFDSVRASKWRHFWTIFGIVIGVTSVITIVSIGEGVKQQVSGQIHHLGKDLITIRPATLHPGSSSGSSSDLLPGLSVSGSISSKDVAIVKQTKGVAAAAPLTIVTGPVKGVHGTYSDGFVIGTTPDLPALLNQSVAYGNFLTDDDMGSNVAIVGPHASDKLFDEDVPFGRTFTFRGQEFIVRGIFNNFNSSPLSQEANFNNAIFIPNDVASTISKNSAPVYEILAKPTDTTKTTEVAKRIKKSLDAAHAGQSNLAVNDSSQNLAGNNTILDLLTRLIAGVAAISLLVGGLGIMNVMLVSVGERMHEIGIRKAVGATNKQILSQFMVEASIISLAGGIIGVIVSLLIDVAIRLTTNLQPIISWQLVAVATGISLLVGIIFGSVPALKAARRAPIDALRSE